MSQTTSFLRLTRRWQPLRFHPVQSQAWHHPARFKTIHAGRRSGKTELFGKRKRVLWLWDCLINRRPWQNPRSFIAAPTRDQVKAIYWRDIKALTPSAWLDGKSETELALYTKWGAELRLVGLDKPDRIEGPPWDEGCIDEYASCKPGIFDGNIRPAMADRKGGIDLIGVPDSYGPAQTEYKSFCNRGRTGTDPEWADFSWDSDGILPPAEIESMRRSMDPRLFLQETSGAFVLAGGRALPDFSRERHVKPCPYDASLPLCWSLDFNINPMCSGIIQYHGDRVRVIDEMVLAETWTDPACTAFLMRAAERGWSLKGLRVYGDATGSARDTTSGESDYAIIKRRLRNIEDLQFRVHRAQASIKDTLNATRSLLLTADGEVRLSIDPRCEQLASDCESALWPSDMEPQHALSWLRYFAEYQFPVMDAMPSGGQIAISS